MITGTAFKQPSVVEQIAATPKYTIRADVAELEKLLGQLHML